MASVFALRALLGAGLGLGALDLVWINGALAPRFAERPAPPPVAVAEAPAPAPVAVPIVEHPDPAPAVEPPQTNTERAITERAYFGTNSVEIGPRSGKTLERIVAEASPTTTFILEGHADYRGDEALNKTLSKDRALAVEDRLVQLGIARDRIQVRYVGEDRASSELWRDRRVDIEITGGTP